MVEIEKSVIRPTYAEWVDIYSEDKEITFRRKQSLVGGMINVETIRPLAIYQKAVEENIEVSEKDMPDINISHDMFRLKGFNSMTQAKKYIAVMKNPDIKDIEVFIDGEEDIVKLNFNLDTPKNPVDKSKYIFTPDFISYNKGNLMDRQLNIISSISAKTTKVKLFDFENSKRVDVYFADIEDAGYNPITEEYSEKQTDDFLPTVKVLAESDPRRISSELYNAKKMLKEGDNVYFIPTVNGKIPKALNRLTSGKKLITRKISEYAPIDTSKSSKEGMNEILPQLEPLPNEFKKYEQKLNEVFEPKSTKKLIGRMQYLTRLEARKAREGRGVGKYTGDRDFQDNRPKLYFYHTLLPNAVYSPQTKSYEGVNILSFFIKTGGDFVPADNMLLFLNEAFVPSYFAESDRNKDWARISWNVAKDAVEGIISYAKDLQVRYRSRKKLNFDIMSEKMMNAFDTNLNEIMENSFFSYMSFDKRRGKRLKVTKSNMLKSATEIKNTFDTILRETYGPLKQFKELDKSELVDFIYRMNHQQKKTYDFEDTRFNIRFDYEPVDERDVKGKYFTEGIRTADVESLFARVNALDGNFKQYFTIKNIAREQSDYVGVLVICYYYDGDEMDRIEAVSLTLQRVEYRPRVIQQVNKDISIEYPADEIGVFMYEIMTGMRRDSPLMLGRGGGSPSVSPSKIGYSFAQDVLDRDMRFAQFFINNMKYNEIRNEFVGFLVGQNPTNKMFQFLFTDSTLRGATSQNMICVGKMDLFYKPNFSQYFIDNNPGFLSRIDTFDDFKSKVTIGLNATESGSCIHFDRDVPKGDQLGTFAMVYLGGAGDPKNFLDGRLNSEVLQGGPISGQQVSRPEGRVRLHYELYNKFGSEFETFIRDIVKKAVESGEIKLGAKFVRGGATAGTEFRPNKANHAIIYTPPKVEIDEGEETQ